jgi:2-polyprenyl-3-methyl-5-hydroxy-6-metoxy-1,4-benzoquinol methylase
MTDTYDEVPYPGYPHSQTHPDHLATRARLFGVQPAPVGKCRVLELGCGDGANLVPMAYGLPESEFVGVDSARLPIAKGNALVEKLGLKNIALRALDVMEIGADFGQFDYIIAYGLYSWVPRDVREKVLAITSANLSPDGVAYVNYNAYPGSHLRNMLREMMLFHAREGDTAGEKIGRARALLELLSKAQFDSEPHRVLLRKEAARVADLADGELWHDDLAQVNSPVYFCEFMEQAARYGLQYLAEADSFEMQDRIFGTEAIGMLERMAGEDVILKEQYMDFLKCRRLRQTILCHRSVELDRTPRPERLNGFYVTSPARASSPEPDVASTAVEEFLGPKGTKITISHPVAKSLLVRLGGAWPEAVELEDLVAHHGTAPEVLLSLYGANFVEFHVHNPRFTMKPGERPLASAVARFQAMDGDVVTNLRHKNIRIEDALARRLLLLLDGTRDSTTLRAKLGVSADELESNLEKVGRLALLEA